MFASPRRDFHSHHSGPRKPGCAYEVGVVLRPREDPREPKVWRSTVAPDVDRSEESVASQPVHPHRALHTDTSQHMEKNSFFVVTNVLMTKNQKQGKCPEVPLKGSLCRTDKDCEKGGWDQQSHGIKTGSCVKFDVLRKTCEVSAWCPVETKRSPPRPALLAAAENFTVLIKNNIRFPAFNYIRRNILPNMNDAYLRSCQRGGDPLCPIFRLGDVVREAGEKFSEMAVELGIKYC
ncbi:P2X purinoceptor 4-like [Notothenia coriiceps]|uniref:P2X purinoceptor 4-like n=1 Tax=Notothenia coriiceps TaxID=8208 RepID=A0A6I9PWX8_9TELE|nr:PREDICTED: P2X purinoceptor 4-like [Notothenia coriiceps]